MCWELLWPSLKKSVSGWFFCSIWVPFRPYKKSGLTTVRVNISNCQNLMLLHINMCAKRAESRKNFCEKNSWTYSKEPDFWKPVLSGVFLEISIKSETDFKYFCLKYTNHQKRKPIGLTQSAMFPILWFFHFVLMNTEFFSYVSLLLGSQKSSSQTDWWETCLDFQMSIPVWLKFS